MKSDISTLKRILDHPFFSSKTTLVVGGVLAGTGIATVIVYKLLVAKAITITAAKVSPMLAAKTSSVVSTPMATTSMSTAHATPTIATQTSPILQQVGESSTTASSDSFLKMLAPLAGGAVGGTGAGLAVSRQQLGKKNKQAEQQNKTIEQLQEQFEVAQKEVADIKTEVARTNKRVGGNNSGNELQRIKGIGPKVSTLLQAANIFSLDELAQIDVIELNRIVRSFPNQQMLKTQSWIAQAKELVEDRTHI